MLRRNFELLARVANSRREIGGIMHIGLCMVKLGVAQVWADVQE